MCDHGQFNLIRYSSCMYTSLFWSRSQPAVPSDIHVLRKIIFKDVCGQWAVNEKSSRNQVMHISWKRKLAVCIFISLHTHTDSNSSERPQMPVLNGELVVHKEWMTTTRNVKKKKKKRNLNQKALRPTLKAYNAFYLRLNWAFETRTE